ncbi:phosphatidate phosphatase LPIN3 isoform X1 [Aedes albopictus]|uniref:phosphatidate phosphatase n=1 Tax=Aedes albopictus TaxID=7160 RepID=A0ABM1Y787_AEDAL|nr:phosphatidate phosphatase LPIN3-like isoform X1 [Aedes albopictus]XP_029725976.1 phosphatidate phosphatase LPIN3-like isoform X1 [Aedes albopictus]XP_029725986.1 phosphatidate phosphatase LPIN3-like isoform X1 [Aedes albopictus]XP_029725987.1 phosphatidate phosphatase LPIN3-like isoform X1 [Aedes albopictus]
MNSIVKVFSNFREFYSEINGATLTGAIDVIIVEQPDGSFVCSPFHVRFGKLGVLRSREKIVDIEINGEPVDIHMKLGESGEAFFVEECLEEDGEVPAHMATSPIPTSSFNANYENSIVTVTKQLEDENLPRPRRNSIDLSKENTESDKSKFENQKSDFSHRRHTDNTTGRPDLTLTKKEFTTQKIRQEWAEVEQEQIFQMDGIESSTTEWQNSTLLPSNNEEDKHFKPIETVPTSTESKPTNSELAVQEDQQAQLLEDKTNADSKSKKKRRKRSIMKKKNSQRKNSSSSSGGSNHSDQNEGVETDSITASQPTASSASGSPKDGEPENVPTVTAENALKETPEIPTRGHELDIHFFSDTEVTAGTSPRQSRPSTPIQSDTEFEISQRENTEGDNMSASWKWGELPTKPEDTEDLSTSQGKQAQRNSMLSGLMSFMKYNNKKMRKNVPEGLYLSDLDESLDPEVAALYFPPVSSKAQHAQTEEDRESGNGTSLPHSPTSLEGIKSLDSDYDDNKDKLSLDFISLSLCGGLDNGTPTYEEFEKHRLQYADVCNNPAIFSSPDLVVRINDKYCSWQAACPQVMTMLAFQKSLPNEQAETPGKPKSLDVAAAGSVDADAQATKQQVSQTSAEANRGGRWWYWRRSNDKATMKTDNEMSEQPSKTSAIATQTSRSNTPEDVGTMTESLSKTKEDGYNGSLSSEDSELPTDQPTHQEFMLNKSDSFIEKYRKTLRLSSEQIESLNLNEGMNEIMFSVTTAYQGTTRCKCYLFKWKYNDKVVISDIDGTITKSDVLGHLLPMVGRNWEQIGVAQLFSKIEENGYKMLYLSARAIGQSKTTRDYLQSIRQGDVKLPDGPLLLNPTSLMSAFHREVIEKKPEQFKIACLSDIQALFPDKNPFYAGYGNRINDVWAYRAVGIPISRIFTINTKGELKHELTQTFQSTYAGQSMVVNDIFPPIMCESSSESEHSDYGQYDDNGDDDDEADSCFEEGDFDRSSSKQRFNSKPKFKQRSTGRCKECDQPELQFPCDIEY